MAKSKKRRNKPLPSSGVSRRSDTVLSATLLLMATAAFLPAAFAGFVWDDVIMTQSKTVAAFSGLFDIWLTVGGVELEGHYWPMVYTTFWLEHKLWGFNPAGFHIVNILLHGCVTVLLWKLLERLAVPGAWLAAAVFAVHPVHAETVAWVIARKDLLASLFYLLAAIYWLRYDESSKTGDYLKMLALFTAGMFSKSFVITLPAAILIWAWWKRGRAGSGDLLRATPMFLTGLIITVYDIGQFNARVVIEFEYSLLERVIIAAKALWFYPAKLLLPSPLPVIYPKWDTAVGNPVNWLPLIAAVAAAAVLWRTRGKAGRGPLAAALFYAVAVSPMLGLANNSYMLYSFAADRYQYLASAALIALFTAAAVNAGRWIASRWTRWTLWTRWTDSANPAVRGRFPTVRGRYIAGIFAAVPLVLYGVLTWRQTRVFQDEIALFNHVISLNPAAHSAHYNLGKALMDKGHLEEAEAAYKAEIARDAANRAAANPKYLNAINYLGSLHFNGGRYEKARELYRYSVGINPENAESHQNLGSALAQTGRYREAVASFERALEIDPELKEAKTNLELARRKLEGR